MKKNLIIFGAILILILAYAGISTSDTKTTSTSLVETVGTDGKIDWGSGIIKATGTGAVPANMSKGQAKLMARRAAIADAQRSLAETLFGVRVSAETYVKNFVTESDEIRTKVEGLVKGAQVIQGSEKFDGEIYELVMVVSLYGKTDSVSSVVIPQVVQKETNVSVDTSTTVQTDNANTTVTTNTTVENNTTTTTNTTTVETNTTTTASTATGATGIIIDARGLGLKPAMSPKILDQNGDEVYGTMFVDTNFAIERGVVAYAKDITKAKQLGRIGNNPLIIKAIDKKGPFKADAVISVDDAKKIRLANESVGFFTKCAVVFVVD